jgi:holo-[acyl-carrier protein] synthase
MGAWEGGWVSEGIVIRVGVDVVEVRCVAESIDRFGDHYLNRVYTEHEIRSCIGSAQVMASGLAARFAAKEATIKLLRPSEHRQPEWRSIEVVRDPEGWCSIELSGHAKELAAAAGMCDLAVSLTHENEIAGAVVIGLFRPNAEQVGVPDALSHECESPWKMLRDSSQEATDAMRIAIAGSREV